MIKDEEEDSSKDKAKKRGAKNQGADDEGGSASGEETRRVKGGSFLLVQRPPTGLLASLWEFPTIPVSVRDAH